MIGNKMEIKFPQNAAQETSWDVLQYVKCSAMGLIDIAVYKITAPMFLLNSLTI